MSKNRTNNNNEADNKTANRMSFVEAVLEMDKMKKEDTQEMEDMARDREDRANPSSSVKKPKKEKKINDCVPCNIL